MCFEQSHHTWLLEAYVASRYLGVTVTCAENLGHGLASSAMVFNYDQRP